MCISHKKVIARRKLAANERSFTRKPCTVWSLSHMGMPAWCVIIQWLSRPICVQRTLDISWSHFPGTVFIKLDQLYPWIQNQEKIMLFSVMQFRPYSQFLPHVTKCRNIGPNCRQKHFSYDPASTEQADLVLQNAGPGFPHWTPTDRPWGRSKKCHWGVQLPARTKPLCR